MLIPEEVRQQFDSFTSMGSSNSVQLLQNLSQPPLKIHFPFFRPFLSLQDPHFKTFNGKAFSYHGECDLVLMRSKSFEDGKGLSIHVRTTRMDNYRGAAYSLISAAAVQMGNTVLEVSADNGGSLLVDGSRRAFTNGDVLSFAAGYTFREV